jgi:hypothetical protein
MGMPIFNSNQQNNDLPAFLLKTGSEYRQLTPLLPKINLIPALCISTNTGAEKNAGTKI